MKRQLIGQIQRPGQRPENAEIIVDERPILTSAEQAAGIQWVNGEYDPGHVLRYGINTTPGTTDLTVAVQAAFDVAKQGGDDVVFPSEAVLHDQITLSSANDFRVVGYGSTSTGSATYAGSYCIQLTDCNRITIEGMRFDRKNSADSGVAHSGIQLLGCSDCVIKNNTFPDVSQCINIDESAAGGSFRNQVIYNTAGPTINAYSAANETNSLIPNLFVVLGTNGNTYNCDDNVISNNVCEDTRIILINHANRTVVSNNSTTNCSDTAIYLSNNTEQTTVTGNNIYYAGKDGIKALEDAKDVVITGNLVYGAGVLKTDGLNCITVSGQVQNVTIAGNYVRLTEETDRPTNNACYGISASGVTDVSITGNTVYALDPDTARDFGIRIVADNTNGNAQRIVVSGNQIENIGIHPIRVATSGTATIDDVAITGNVINGFDTTGTQYGISIDDAGGGAISNVMVTNNHIKTFSTAGIEVDGTDHVHIHGNFFGDAAATAECVRQANTSTNLFVGYNSSDRSEASFYAMIGTSTPNTISYTTSDTLVGGYGGEIHNNTGATGSITLTLPPAEPGLRFSFDRAAAQNIVLDGSGSETIEDTAPGTGTYSTTQTMATADTTCVIECIRTGRWELMAGGY